MDSPLVWAEVNLEAIAHNVSELRGITNPKARLMAVVKANAYGHGMIEVARRALENGADSMGVARIEEGIELRKAGFNESVLIFGYTPPALAHKLIGFDLTQTVWSYNTAKALSDIAVSSNKKIKVHLKVDTGMGRLGVWHADALALLDTIQHLPNLTLAGIYTHFSSADSDREFTRLQRERFLAVLDQTDTSGLLIHADNSASLNSLSGDSAFNAVRVGLSLSTCLRRFTVR